MKYSNVKGFGWGQGEVGEKKTRAEAVVETNENKRNVCPEYLKVGPCACAFLRPTQYALL